MLRLRRLAAAAGLVAATMPGFAAAEDAYTAALLLRDFQLCDTRPDDYRCGRAATYVKGFAKRLLQGHVGNPEHPQICLRPDIGVAELMDVTRAFVEAHPERSDELAVWLVRDALIGAYPCKQ